MQPPAAQQEGFESTNGAVLRWRCLPDGTLAPNHIRQPFDLVVLGKLCGDGFAGIWLVGQIVKGQSIG